MSFLSILETFFIGPLKLMFEIIFQVVNSMVNDPGISIIFLSLVMNLLVLPLYRRADAMQEQARDIEAKLHDGVTHIKKTFSGDERMMMLQAYYRQNNYSPTNALRGSVSLLLEIPFFMAAYQFLSHLSILNGISFGPVADLGKPDGMLIIGGLTVNVLPVLMTLINVISSAIYLRGFPLKTKIQLYAMALFFLVFLYTSPAGLVFYWTLNNLFSLIKNIFYKLKNPKKVIAVLSSLVGASAFLLLMKVAGRDTIQLTATLAVVGILLQIPSILYLLKDRKSAQSVDKPAKPNKKLFIAAALFLTVFIGLLIPSNYIAASPQEYVDVTAFFHPLWYVVSALCLAGGTFLLWIGVFYWLASPRGKVIFERVLWICCGVAIMNYMFFGTKLGVVSSTLQYGGNLYFSVTEVLLNILAVAAVAWILWLVVVRWIKVSRAILLVATLSIVVMSGINVVATKQSVDEIKVQGEEIMPHFSLSKEGKNVVVLLLDRAMGEYLPYLINEKPELKEMFDGFTYYSNVISYGGHTNMAAPALMGGYEYTPIEMNKRDGESLKDKHNESLKVMPVMFLENGYRVTVCDAPYANYKWIPDMSMYDDYPEIETYITKGYFGATEMKEQVVTGNLRNFFCFGLMKSLPLFMQFGVYHRGDYYMATVPAVAASQDRLGLSHSTGMSKAFMEPFEVLRNLKTMTNISDGAENNFLFLYNDAPHEPMLLQEPDYLPSPTVDNSAYDEAHKDRFTVDGKTIEITTEKQMIHYHANMASLLQVGKWLDYLRENDVYDNTRIILVADHGYYLYQSEVLVHQRGTIDISNYFPLMMVKDFDSTGFHVCDDFMTNADVPTIATEGVIPNPVNPFTGKPINSDEKTAHDHFIMTSRDWSVDSNNGNRYSATKWAIVTNNIWDRDDWKFIDSKKILMDHKIP